MSAEKLGEWFEAYGPELLLFARQITDEPHRAEDIVQEAYIKLLGQRPTPDNIRAWLYRVVRNEALSMKRRLRRRLSADKTLVHETEYYFESRTDDLIDAATVQRLLEALPKLEREIVSLRIWGQLTLQETADIVHRPVSTVHQIYRQALEKIRLTLERSSCKTEKR